MKVFVSTLSAIFRSAVYQKNSGSRVLPELAKEVSSGFHHSPVAKARCARKNTERMPRSLAV
jgi:hypothetical protein